LTTNQIILFKMKYLQKILALTRFPQEHTFTLFILRKEIYSAAGSKKNKK